MGAERGLRCFSQVALNPPCGRWKTYVGRPRGDLLRSMAMTYLAGGLSSCGRDDESLAICTSHLDLLRGLESGKRHPKTLATENNILSTRAMQRRVIEELTPTGEWSIIVSKRRAFVRLLKKP